MAAAAHPTIEETRSCWGCKKSSVIGNDLFCTKSAHAVRLLKEDPCAEHKDMWA